MPTDKDLNPSRDFLRLNPGLDLVLRGSKPAEALPLDPAQARPRPEPAGASRPDPRPQKARAARGRGGPRWRVSFVVFARGEIDDDNLGGRLKEVRDRIAERLEVDDGEKRRIRFQYSSVNTSGEAGVLVLIEREGTVPPLGDVNG